MYTLNKIAWAVLNPAFVGFAVLFISIVLYRRRFFRVVGALALVWLWIWCMPLITDFEGRLLENDYVLYSEDGEPHMREAADYPVCDAIADLGGGTGSITNFYSGAYLNSSADRAYFSALLWKAGKAPIVIPSGVGCAQSDCTFLKDLGVPEAAIVVDDKARNTEENAKFVCKMLKERVKDRVPRLLVVTSAWHMKRSLLMFEKYAPGIEVVPVACDFECAAMKWEFDLRSLLPNFEIAGRNSIYFHEWLGYWWYRYIRK